MPIEAFSDCRQLSYTCRSGTHEPSVAFTFPIKLADGKLLYLRRDGVCSQCACALPAGIQAYWTDEDRTALCTTCWRPAPAVPQAEASAPRESEWHWWDRGADDQRQSRQRLEALLADAPVRLLHDRRLPGNRANIDHIAVGPGGVTVFAVGRRRRNRDLSGLELQIEVVRTVLMEERLAHIAVQGALCTPGVAELPPANRLQVGDVVIDGPRRIARLISEGGRLDTAAVEKVASALERRLPTA